jgi:hypothetical protein
LALGIPRSWLPVAYFQGRDGCAGSCWWGVATYASLSGGSGIEAVGGGPKPRRSAAEQAEEFDSIVMMPSYQI